MSNTHLKLGPGTMIHYGKSCSEKGKIAQSELSILTKVDLWIHHVDWKINVSLTNAQNGKIKWRPASNPNLLEIMLFITTV